jgi:hypothetical protein
MIRRLLAVAIFVSVGCSSSSKGDKGDPGPPGATGPTGPAGPQGPPGPAPIKQPRLIDSAGNVAQGLTVSANYTESPLYYPAILASVPFIDSAGMTWWVVVNHTQATEAVQGYAVFGFYSDAACTTLVAVIPGGPNPSVWDWTTIGVTRFDQSSVVPTPQESYRPMVQPHSVGPFYEVNNNGTRVCTRLGPAPGWLLTELAPAIPPPDPNKPPYHVEMR